MAQMHRNAMTYSKGKPSKINMLLPMCRTVQVDRMQKEGTSYCPALHRTPLHRNQAGLGLWGSKGMNPPWRGSLDLLDIHQVLRSPKRAQLQCATVSL